MSDPYAPARDFVARVADHLNLPTATAERLSRRHEADMRVDPATGVLAYDNGAADTAGWLRIVEKSDPALLGKAVSLAATTPTATTSTNASDVMALARSGALSADEATARLLAPKPTETAPKPATELNFSVLMTQARAGDAAALAALNSMVHTR